jgi:hypothetical protein
VLVVFYALVAVAVKGNSLINVYNKEQANIFLLIAVASFVMQVLLNVHLQHNQIRKVHLNLHLKTSSKRDLMPLN